MSFYVEKDKCLPVDVMKQKKKRKWYQNYEKKKKPERKKNHIVWLEQKKIQFKSYHKNSVYYTLLAVEAWLWGRIIEWHGRRFNDDAFVTGTLLIGDEFRQHKWTKNSSNIKSKSFKLS